jgi:hypothetical protein
MDVVDTVDDNCILPASGACTLQKLFPAVDDANTCTPGSAIAVVIIPVCTVCKKIDEDTGKATGIES